MPHNKMWSPWRSAHIATFESKVQRAEGEGSIFSRMAAEGDDEKHFVLWRGTHVFVVMNLYPYNNGHLLVVPYREVSDYGDLSEEEKLELSRAMDLALQWLKHALEPDGFNVGMNIGDAAGAGIPEHLHMHVVPRWRGDTNFMPTTADVKVIPEAMEETYAKLRRAVQASSKT